MRFSNEPRGARATHTLKSLATLLIAAMLLAAPTLAGAQTRKRGRGEAEERGGTQSVRPPSGGGQTRASSPAAGAATGGMPPRVEIGDGISSPNATVILGLNESTYFKCDSKVLQLISGVNMVGVDEDDGGQPQVQPEVKVFWERPETGRFGFYLIPQVLNIDTNFRIEMESNTVTVRLRTFGGKKPRPGDYHNEVMVRSAGFRDELARTKARVVELETAKTDLEQRLASAQSAATLKLTAATEEESARGMNTTFALLRALAADDGKKSKGPKLPSAEGEGLRLTQQSRVVKDPYGRLWVLVKVEATAKGAKGNAVVERIDSSDGRNVRCSTALPKVLAAGAAESLAVLVEGSPLAPAAGQKPSPSGLSFILAGGKTVTLSLVN